MFIFLKISYLNEGGMLTNSRFLNWSNLFGVSFFTGGGSLNMIEIFLNERFSMSLSEIICTDLIFMMMLYMYKANWEGSTLPAIYTMFTLTFTDWKNSACIW